MNSIVPSKVPTHTPLLSFFSAYSRLVAELVHSHSCESGAAALSSRPGGGPKFGRGSIARVGPMPSNSVAAAIGGDHALNADLLESFRDTVKKLMKNTLFLF